VPVRNYAGAAQVIGARGLDGQPLGASLFLFFPSRAAFLLAMIRTMPLTEGRLNEWID
jgi:hypothetical protein